MVRSGDRTRMRPPHQNRQSGRNHPRFPDERTGLIPGTMQLMGNFCEIPL